jgi:phospholipid-transporting ATPase
LRTLVLAKRELTLQEYSDWKEIFHQAVTSIDNREERVEAACEIIENDLVLLGCTAIEDKLQEQVPETIHYLLEAGIQIWVLTGDKQETAINIGYSSRLLTPDMELIIINAENSEICGEVLKAVLERYCGRYYDPEEGILTEMNSNGREEEPRTLGMVIDGHSLGFALHDHTEAFLNLGKACRSVICCRVTPLQKALVVRVVKQGEQKISCAIGKKSILFIYLFVYLSIGDGANDVSMIQEAHVGIGIYGKEGTQAARASDYAIHQFKHLKRLLCVHGRYSYMRVTGIIQYSFYKNMAFTLSMLYFSWYNGFTGQTLYDSWIITFYNIIFTSLPPLFYGLFEKDINEELIYKVSIDTLM